MVDDGTLLDKGLKTLLEVFEIFGGSVFGLKLLEDLLLFLEEGLSIVEEGLEVHGVFRD